MKTKIGIGFIAAFALAVVLGAVAGIASYTQEKTPLAAEGDFVGVYDRTAFAAEETQTSSQTPSVNVNGTAVDATTVKTIASSDGQYRLFVAAIDAADLASMKKVVVGYVYDGIEYNGPYAEGVTGLTNTAYESLTIKISETEKKTFSVAQMFYSQITDFGKAVLIVAEVPAADGVTDAILAAERVDEADFAKDFQVGTQYGAWRYGYADYVWADEDFTFTQATALNSGADGWVADGVEIKAGWINATGGMAAIAYTAREATAVDVDLTFTGGTENTNLSLRIGVKNKDGIKYSDPAFYREKNSKDLTVSTRYRLNAGDTVYFLFNNETSDPYGDLNVSLRQMEGVDFAAEFSAQENPNGAWSYGSAVYTWVESEDFTFTQATALNSGEDGWVADGVEIKAGWINAGATAAIAYTATEEENFSVYLHFVGGTENTKLSVRIGVKSAEGTLYSNPAYYVGSGNTLSVVFADYSLNAGDTVYFLFFNENGADASAYPNGGLTITLYR